MIVQNDAKRIGGALLIVAALVLGTLISVPANAQVVGATLSGTITDPSGAVIPGAQVSITNVATGVVTAVTTNADGFYRAPNLLPGTYEAAVSARGFSIEVQAGVYLTVGAAQVLNFTLRMGQATEKVQVTAQAPAVQLASSSISAVVDSKTVTDLPLNGRDWTQLATLQPGVNVVPTQVALGVNSKRVNRGFGNQMTISGTRPQMNNYRLDGISIVDYAGGAPGSSLGISLGVDAVAEFSVLTSNYDASYGRTSGGVINAVTRTGTNQFHGDAYWFLRDEDFDARNFFDQTLAPFHRNQFGASGGGPIQKDKTFFFVDYEGFRQTLGVTNVDNVPSQDARNGVLHNSDGTTCTIGIPSPGCALTNSAGTVGVDPLVKPYLAFYPLPNAGPLGNGDTGQFLIATSNISKDNFETVKIDRKLSEKNSIFGTWFYDTGSNAAPDSLNDRLVGNTSARQMIALEDTQVFSSSLVNAIRFGYSRVVEYGNRAIQAINPLTTDKTLGAFPGRAAPAISVPGLTDFIGGSESGSGADNTWNSFQAYDDAFLTRGLHSLKFGFAFERMQTNRKSTVLDPATFSFGSFSDFLTNQPSTFKGDVPGHATGELHERQSLFGGYLQDDWRWRPNLTLNLGLRYEMTTILTDAHGRLANLRNFTDTAPFLGSPLLTSNPTLHNFEPRVGFAWDPFQKGRTAVRGAFGIFDVLPLSYDFFGSAAAAPFEAMFNATNLPSGSFPTGAASSAIGATLDQSQLMHSHIQPNPSRNYVMTWNLNIQQQLTSSTTVMVGYVGNHGVHMLNRADDANIVPPVNTPEGLLWPSPPGSGTKINPNFVNIKGLFWSGTSLYDALQVGVTKRMGHGFQVQGSYTWGKGIDTGSASSIGDPYTNSISSLLMFCNACRRGLSDYDIAHTLVINYIWHVPTPTNWGAVGSHVLGGWELGGILTAETGVPFTPLIGGDPLGLNTTDPFAYPSRVPGCNPINTNFKNTPGLSYININCFVLPAATPAIAAQCSPFGFAAPSGGNPGNPGIPGTCANLFGNAGRNTVIGPGLVTFDVSLFKNNYIPKISETFNAQFRAEFFNVLNRPNFATPVGNSTFFDQSGNPVGGAGVPNQTSTTSRQIQFALKLIW